MKNVAIADIFDYLTVGWCPFAVAAFVLFLVSAQGLFLAVLGPVWYQTLNPCAVNTFT